MGNIKLQVAGPDAERARALGAAVLNLPRILLGSVAHRWRFAA